MQEQCKNSREKGRAGERKACPKQRKETRAGGEAD